MTCTVWHRLFFLLVLGLTAPGNLTPAGASIGGPLPGGAQQVAAVYEYDGQLSYTQDLRPSGSPLISQRSATDPFGDQVEGRGPYDDLHSTSTTAHQFVATKPGVPQAEIDAIGGRISPQAQARHIEGTPQWTARGEGGYFKSPADAQAVLDAVKSGQAQVIGRTANGQLIVRYDGVTGFNNNAAAGFVDQPTNVFIVKGTSKVSVVPTSPGATAK